MNAFGFNLKRMIQFFGFDYQWRRVDTLSRETLLLKEAVEILGKAAWSDTADIEEIAVEYWQIMDYEKQQQELNRIASEIEEEIQVLETRRLEFQAECDEEIDRLQQEKEVLMHDVAVAEQKMEVARGDIHKLERLMEGMQMKMKIGGSSLGDQADALKKRVTDIEEKIENRKTTINEFSERLDLMENNAFAIGDKITEKRAEHRAVTKDIFTQLGKKTKQLTGAIAKIGALQLEKDKLAGDVGKYLSRHSQSSSPEIRTILNKHRSLVAKINQFKRSIGYYQRLSSR